MFNSLKPLWSKSARKIPNIPASASPPEKNQKTKRAKP